MQIYWQEDGKRRGPATVPDILSLIRLGELRWDTPGWHTGCQGWRPLRELPALVDFAPTQTPTDGSLGDSKPSAQGAVESEEPPTLVRVTLPSPLQRFFARIIDCSVYAVLVLGIMRAFGVPYHQFALPSSPLFWLPFPLAEALMLRYMGCTPGKLWMRIHLLNAGKLHFSILLGRSIHVFIFGMGLMVPLFMLVTLTFSYFDVRRIGLSWWDRRAGAVFASVSHHSLVYVLSAVIFVFLCTQMCCLFLSPWLPDMLEQLRQENPQLVEYIRDMLQQ